VPVCGCDAAGRCVAGGGGKRTDCLVELLPLAAAGRDPARSAVACRDGDPACDQDGLADGRCTFALALCVENTDPGLPRCTPRPLRRLELSTPAPVAELAALAPLGTPVRRGRRLLLSPLAAGEAGRCSAAFRVPVAAPAGGRTPVRYALRLRADDVDGRRDRDRVTLVCAR
jgi:hypothetical protein